MLIGLLSFFSGCSTTRTPQDVYEAAWKETEKRIYNPAVLGDWNQWHHRFDGKIKDDKDAETYADEMLGTTKDPYCDLISVEDQRLEKMRAEGKFAGLGVGWLPLIVDGKKLRNAKRETLPESTSDGYCILEIMKGSPAEEAGIKSGDALISVEGTSTKSRSITNIATSLRGAPGESITLTYRHEAETKTVKITRKSFATPGVTSKMLNGNVGYIYLPGFGLDDAAGKLRAELIKLNKADSLILDLRDNGGGYVHHALSILAMLVEDGVLVVRHQRTPGSPERPQYNSVTYRLTHHSMWTDTESKGKVIKTVATREAYLLRGRRLVVLVNENSASASELVSGSLKDNGVATLIGTTTFGKGIGQETFGIGRGMQLKLTTFRYYTPSGFWPGNGDDTGPGITPAIIVKPNVRFFEKGSDEDNQLKAAVQYLKEKKGGTQQ